MRRKLALVGVSVCGLAAGLAFGKGNALLGMLMLACIGGQLVAMATLRKG